MSLSGSAATLLSGLILTGLALASCAHSKSSCPCKRDASRPPPAARKQPKELTIHGDTRVDNYYWLREKTSPEVIAYLEAENNYTRKMMKHTEKFQESLYKEMLGRIKETDQTAPVKEDDFYYYSRSEEGKQYDIYCRKEASLDAPEEVYLDANELAKGHKHFALGALSTSPDHKILAYSIDTTGAETFTLVFKDLDTGKLLPDKIPGVYYGAVWANDNKTVYYVTQDKAKRPHKLHRHVLGTDPAEDVLVYHEKDEKFWLGMSKTRSRAYVLIHLDSMTTSEIRFFPADETAAEPKLVEPRRHKVEYSLSHQGDRFFIVTNDDGATNFKLVEAPVATPGRANWKEVIAHRKDVKVEFTEAFENHLVVVERKSGLKRIRVRELAHGEEHYITFPEPVYTVWTGANPMYDSATLRFVYTSLVTPESVFDYDMNTKKRELKKEEVVLGGYDRAKYRSERVFATGEDGTRIPISLVYGIGFEKNGNSPMYLTGYGSYGSSRSVSFSSNRLSLLDRGFVFAIAHVRGGGEMGRPWYDAGKLLHKKNTFTDFISCAEYLLAQGYSTSDRLAITGGSAGGLLMGAVINMRPELFQSVVADVPFVDVVTTMLDETIPLTVTEFEEWGNPKEKEFYEYMKSYSPYDNVEAKDYPRLLITAGLNDPRVQYWEPAKWAAKLRANKTDDNLLLLKTKMDSGHMGASGRYDYLKELAFEYAFVLDGQGIDR